MPSNLVSFIQVLRTHDVRISPAETLDAMNVATTLGYADRTLLRDGLGMALAKTPEEEAVYLRCFDRFFDQQLADFSAVDDPDIEQGVTPFDEDADEGGDAGESAAIPPLEEAASGNQELQALMNSDLMQKHVRHISTRNICARNRGSACIQNQSFLTTKRPILGPLT